MLYKKSQKTAVIIILVVRAVIRAVVRVVVRVMVRVVVRAVVRAVRMRVVVRAMIKTVIKTDQKRNSQKNQSRSFFNYLDTYEAILPVSRSELHPGTPRHVSLVNSPIGANHEMLDCCSASYSERMSNHRESQQPGNL